MSARILTPAAIDPLTLLGSALEVWYRDSATISSVASAVGGSSPPAITLGGTLAYGSPMPSIRFTCTVGGANPTLSYSADNSATIIGTVSPTPGGPAAALSGVLTGTTVLAPVATYNTNNVWRFGCASWTDLSGNGEHLDQTPGTACPLITPDATLGQRSLVFDATDDFIQNLTCPVGLPSNWVLVYKTNAWTNGRNIRAGNTPGVVLQLFQMAGSAPSLDMSNNGAAIRNSSATVGNWVRTVQSYSDSLKDYSLIAGNIGTVLDNCGDESGTGFRFGTNASGSAFTSMSLCEAFKVSRDLSIYEGMCLDMYFFNRYGASLGLG